MKDEFNGGVEGIRKGNKFIERFLAMCPNQKYIVDISEPDEG